MGPFGPDNLLCATILEGQHMRKCHMYIYIYIYMHIFSRLSPSPPALRCAWFCVGFALLSSASLPFSVSPLSLSLSLCLSPVCFHCCAARRDCGFPPRGNYSESALRALFALPCSPRFAPPDDGCDAVDDSFSGLSRFDGGKGLPESTDAALS